MNIGNPNEFTMLELAEHRARGHRLELRDRVRAAARSATRPGAGPTSPAPRTLLGWEPTVALRDGLARMHDWYLEERRRGRA